MSDPNAVFSTAAAVDEQFRAAEAYSTTDYETIDVTTANANTEVEVTHHLGKVPNGFVVIQQDKAGSTYVSTGGTAWSTTKLYIKNATATVALKIMVF